MKLFRKIRKLKRLTRWIGGMLSSAAIVSAVGCTNFKDVIKDYLLDKATTILNDAMLDVSNINVDVYKKEITVLNGNMPYFTDDLKEIEEGEDIFLSELDSLGRCGTATMLVCKANQPTEKRESDLSSVTPSGWKQMYYESIENGWLYNRSHLLGYQLSGLNAEKKNLITGTRWFNLAMIPYENKVDNAVENDSNALILYRVTPYFVDNELVARGVVMEAYSLNDNGKTVCYCVWIPNVQPGIDIDYLTGESYIES